MNHVQLYTLMDGGLAPLHRDCVHLPGRAEGKTWGGRRPGTRIKLTEEK